MINEPTAYSKLMGEDTPKYEALIQRGASSSWAPKNTSSRLIMYACKWMVKNTSKRIFIAYADPKANEMGIIYQACGFDYIGANYGNAFLYKHPEIKKGGLFSSQTLKRTSTFRGWCFRNGIELRDEWFNEKGFKNLSTIPIEIKHKWREWIHKIISESERVGIERKHKYALIRACNKKERQQLIEMRKYSPMQYPKK
jgi:hypothetical protein